MTEDMNTISAEMNMLKLPSQELWKKFTAKYEPEIRDEAGESGQMLVIQKIFILAAHILEKSGIKPKDPISAISQALEMHAPNSTLAEKLFDRTWKPATFKEIANTFELDDARGLGVMINNHLEDHSDPQVLGRLTGNIL